MRRRIRALGAFALFLAFAAAVMVAGSQVHAVTQPAASSQDDWGTWKAFDGSYTVDFPRDWSMLAGDQSNKAKFIGNHAGVSVATAVAEPGETVEGYLEANKSNFKRQCATAEEKEKGQTTVAGFPGAFVTMYCGESEHPYVVRIAASLHEGRFYNFNVTASPAELPLAQAAIDRMARSFKAGDGLPGGAGTAQTGQVSCVCRPPESFLKSIGCNL